MGKGFGLVPNEIFGAIDAYLMDFVNALESASKHREFAFRIRVFSTRGQYPRGVIASDTALFFADDDLVFSVVLAKPYDQMASNFPYSEMAWVTPQETRFWSSIVLCEDEDAPKILLYPQRYNLALIEQVVDLTDSETQQALKARIIYEIKSRKAKGRHYFGDNLDNNYSLFERDTNLDRQPLFYRRIDESDHVLLRGVICLIKCDMLSRYIEFSEEAIIVCFIALEASFSLVMDRLRREGVLNPSAKDAGRWLDDTFNRPLGIDPGDRRYFEELYEQRIMTMHPNSRYGEYPYAPLMHDDLFDLRRDLREVFAYLVSGLHGPEFNRKLTRYSLDVARRI